MKNDLLSAITLWLIVICSTIVFLTVVIMYQQIGAFPTQALYATIGLYFILVAGIGGVPIYKLLTKSKGDENGR